MTTTTDHSGLHDFAKDLYRQIGRLEQENDRLCVENAQLTTQLEERDARVRELADRLRKSITVENMEDARQLPQYLPLHKLFIETWETNSGSTGMVSLTITFQLAPRHDSKAP